MPCQNAKTNKRTNAIKKKLKSLFWEQFIVIGAHMCVVRICVNNRCGTKHVYQERSYRNRKKKLLSKAKQQQRTRAIRIYRPFIFGLTDLCIKLNVARSPNPDLPQYFFVCLTLNGMSPLPKIINTEKK